MNIVSFAEKFLDRLQARRLRFFAISCAATSVATFVATVVILRTGAHGLPYTAAILAVFAPSVLLFLSFAVKMYRNVMTYLVAGRVDALALAFTYVLLFLAQFFLTLLTCSQVAFG